jgi:hypothetical protein
MSGPGEISKKNNAVRKVKKAAVLGISGFLRTTEESSQDVTTATDVFSVAIIPPAAPDKPYLSAARQELRTNHSADGSAHPNFCLIEKPMHRL